MTVAQAFADGSWAGCGPGHPSGVPSSFVGDGCGSANARLARDSQMGLGGNWAVLCQIGLCDKFLRPREGNLRYSCVEVQSSPTMSLLQLVGSPGSVLDVGQVGAARASSPGGLPLL